MKNGHFPSGLTSSTWLLSNILYGWLFKSFYTINAIWEGWRNRWWSKLVLHWLQCLEENGTEHVLSAHHSCWLHYSCRGLADACTAVVEDGWITMQCHCSICVARYTQVRVLPTSRIGENFQPSVRSVRYCSAKRESCFLRCKDCHWKERNASPRTALTSLVWPQNLQSQRTHCLLWGCLLDSYYS